MPSAWLVMLKRENSPCSIRCGAVNNADTHFIKVTIGHVGYPEQAFSFPVLA